MQSTLGSVSKLFWKLCNPLCKRESGAAAEWWMTKRLITTLNRGLYRFHNNLMVRQTRQEQFLIFSTITQTIFSYYILCYSQIVCFGPSRGHSNIQSADQETSFISAAAITFFNNCGVLPTHSWNQNRQKLQNTSPNFWYMVGAKMVGKSVETRKKIFHDGLFCKVKLSKMASTKIKKINE